MLGYLPGLIHAWYIIAKHPEYDYEQVPDSEQNGGRVTYYYVSHEQRPQRAQRVQGPSYGTAGNAPQVPKTSRPVNGSDAAGPSTGAGSGEAGAPPSYADAVKGDHKVQSRE